MAQSLTVKVHVQGAREALAAFRRLPRQASDSLRERTLELSQTLAKRVASAARSDSPQSALMAPTVKAVRDRIPAITAGGTTRVGRNSAPAYKILFGSEFGAIAFKQFRPHLGQDSYWLFATVLENEATIGAAWLQVARDIERDFTAGPGA